jgi:hypothetical protein
MRSATTDDQSKIVALVGVRLELPDLEGPPFLPGKLRREELQTMLARTRDALLVIENRLRRQGGIVPAAFVSRLNVAY